MQKHVNVKEWVAMFKAIGLDESKMNQWHNLFEAQHPEAHQSFLEWLGLPPKDITAIRSRSR
jgi:hypothetical protein